MPVKPEDRVGQLIRHTHHYGFRSGQWAEVVSVMVDPENARASYLVEFPDGVSDHWAVEDPSEPYEFAAGSEEQT